MLRVNGRGGKGRVWIAVAGAGTLVAMGLVAQRIVTLGEQRNGTFLVPTNQTLSPIGQVVRFEYARPKDLAVSPDGSAVAVLAHRRLVVLRPDGTMGGQLDMGAGPLGVAWTPDGKTICASRGERAGRGGGVGRERADEGAGLSREHAHPRGQADRRESQLTGLAVSPDGGTLFVGMSIRNAVAEVDLASGSVRRVIPTGVAPPSA